MTSSPRVRIVVPDDVPSVLNNTPAHRRLEEIGEVELHLTEAASVDELLQRLAGAPVVVNIRGRTRFTREVFAALPDLRLVSIWGTGTDNVDLPAAADHGVTVMNTPGVSANSVAEGTLTLMLATARQIPRIDAAVKAGEWPRAMVSQLYGKTLGVLGTGAIGAQMARLGKGIGMSVIAWSRTPNPALAEEIGLRYVSREEVLRTADVVSIHVRLTPETTNMIGRAELAMMKPTALLLNSARGACVDEEALVEALHAGTIAGAGLDVFAVEPIPADHPLLTAPNVVMTPHSAGVTPEALLAGLQLAADNVGDFLNGTAKQQYIVAGPGR
jgi:phosphoglycerate dehydrogenase-like enzyme